MDRQYDVPRAMFTYAVRSDWITRTPCRDIRLPSVTETRRMALSVEDVVALAEAIDPRYETMVWLGAALDLRWAEVVGLTVRSLDLLRNTATQQLGRDRRRPSPSRTPAAGSSRSPRSSQPPFRPTWALTS